MLQTFHLKAARHDARLIVRHGGGAVDIGVDVVIVLHPLDDWCGLAGNDALNGREDLPFGGFQEIFRWREGDKRRNV